MYTKEERKSKIKVNNEHEQEHQKLSGHRHWLYICSFIYYRFAFAFLWWWLLCSCIKSNFDFLFNLCATFRCMRFDRIIFTRSKRPSGDARRHRKQRNEHLILFSTFFLSLCAVFRGWIRHMCSDDKHESRKWNSILIIWMNASIKIWLDSMCYEFLNILIWKSAVERECFGGFAKGSVVLRRSFVWNRFTTRFRFISLVIICIPFCEMNNNTPRKKIKQISIDSTWPETKQCYPILHHEMMRNINHFEEVLPRNRVLFTSIFVCAYLKCFKSRYAWCEHIAHHYFCHNFNRSINRGILLLLTNYTSSIPWKIRAKTMRFCTSALRTATEVGERNWRVCAVISHWELWWTRACVYVISFVRFSRRCCTDENNGLWGQCVCALALCARHCYYYC